MAPKLYMTLYSPPVRAVLLTEAALGLKLEHVEVDLMKGEHLKPEYVEINSQHTVPLLIDDDGTKVRDSHAIMGYLIAKYAKDDALYPREPALRADIDHKLHFDSQCIFSLVKRIFVPIKQNKTKVVSGECKEQALINYDLLNTFLKGKQWISGNQLTIADFSLITSITSLNIFVPIDNTFENVWNWISRMEKLPYYQINANGVKILDQHFKYFTQQK